ncbi:hypothetical protein [Pseudooceanicola sp.]|uniref:hypothetical protein n=1 Tax=Pseudooceanicola sp. TaxID=1914328 RepID=UPI002620E5B0|nr:hypothetical protein [Pseudooceanicola sp.]MDF1855303.1 hypothetical protein [Pseudooceanicola sp.]
MALSFLSANFDEAVFDIPQESDPDRSPTRHLWFGIDPPNCAGQSLAKLPLRIVLNRLRRG